MQVMPPAMRRNKFAVDAATASWRPAAAGSVWDLQRLRAYAASELCRCGAALSPSQLNRLQSCRRYRAIPHAACQNSSLTHRRGACSSLRHVTFRLLHQGHPDQHVATLPLMRCASRRCSKRRHSV